MVFSLADNLRKDRLHHDGEGMEAGECGGWSYRLNSLETENTVADPLSPVYSAQGSSQWNVPPQLK